MSSFSVAPPDDASTTTTLLVSIPGIHPSKSVLATTTTTTATATIQCLEEEYRGLVNQEAELEDILERLQTEEAALVEATVQVDPTPTIVPPKPQHRQAILRLEEALMQELSADSTSSSSSSSSNDDDDDDDDQSEEEE